MVRQLIPSFSVSPAAEKPSARPSRRAENGEPTAFEAVLNAKEEEQKEKESALAAAVAAVPAPKAPPEPVQENARSSTGSFSADTTAAPSGVNETNGQALSFSSTNLTPQAGPTGEAVSSATPQSPAVGVEAGAATAPAQTAGVSSTGEALTTGEMLTGAALMPEEGATDGQPAATSPQAEQPSEASATQPDPMLLQPQGAETAETPSGAEALAQGNQSKTGGIPSPTQVQSRAGAQSNEPVNAVASSQASSTSRDVGPEAPQVKMTHHESAAPVAAPDGGASAVRSAALNNPTVETTVPATSYTEVSSQVAQAAVTALQSGRNSVRLQLHPHELGGIEIRIISDAHGVSVAVLADQPTTGQMLEQRADQLRQTLADAGVQLSNLNVGQHNQSAGQQRDFSRGLQPGSHPHRGRPESDPGEVATTPVSSRGRQAQGIDYRI